MDDDDDDDEEEEKAQILKMIGYRHINRALVEGEMLGK